MSNNIGSNIKKNKYTHLSVLSVDKKWYNITLSKNNNIKSNHINCNNDRF